MTNPHFAWLPPEINSALIFAGPGAGPLEAAAAAWTALAEELASSAQSFGSVTSELVSGSWLGPSAAAMMAVATQYAAWLGTAAAHAEKAAGQATAVAGSFEATLMSAVQPAVVAANRGLAQLLAATNWLGQNAPAIADIEAAYEQMWAMDVDSMANYHSEASALLSQLPSWDQVLQALNIDDVGFGNLGHANIGLGNNGDRNIGFGNLGSGNIGFGNTGDGNIGFGLTGDHKIGIGIGLFSNGNVGFGNAGKGNIGFGNSGTGNIGFFNSGTGNFGIFNSGALNTGLGNMGYSNLGFLNAGFGQTGFLNQSAQAINSFFGSDNVNGALNAASLNRPLLDPTNFITGGYPPELASSAMLNSGLASAPVSAAAAVPLSALPPVSASLPLSPTASVGSSIAAPSIAAPTAAIGAAPAPAVRNTNSGDNPRSEPGQRNPVRAGQGVPADGIPSSGFFDKLTPAPVGPGIQEPDSAD